MTIIYIKRKWFCITIILDCTLFFNEIYFLKKDEMLINDLYSAKSGKTERQFRFIGLPFRFSGTLDYN